MTESEPSGLAPAPDPISVVLKHEEVMAAALASRSRGQSGGWPFTLLLLVLLAFAIWAGHLASFYFAQQLPFSIFFAFAPYLPVAVPAAFAAIAVHLALTIEQRRATRAYLRHLGRVGSPLERSATYEVTPEALVLTTERIVIAPRWHAVDTLEKGSDGWVVSADQLHLLIPFADFADHDAQRPLIAAITSRMTPDARARSREAVEFGGVASGTVARRSSTAGARRAESETPPVPARDPPSAAGWLTQEQAGWAAGVVYRKVAKAGFHRWAYPLTGAVTGMLVGALVLALVAAVLPVEAWVRFPGMIGPVALLLPLAGGALGLAYGHRRLAIVLDKAWRSGLAVRGVPEQAEARWSLTETGVLYSTPRFSGEATYASLHQVLHEHGHWIIAADALTLCIPDTAFAGPGEANAFTAALLARMSEPARARSVRLPPGPIAS